MSRFNENRWQINTSVSARDAEPWVASGKLTTGTVIKNRPGLLGEIVVTASDVGGDVDVIVWDSATSTTTNDEELARVRIPETVAGTQSSFSAPSKEGVFATDGIYVAVTGDCEFIVYYK